jgi:small neutral amino acid transporter SnatA (MarC family)
MVDFLNALTLLLILLNPFLVVVYLIELIQDLDRLTFSRVLIRGGIISSAIFILFALLGDAVFSSILHVEFASFQIFGGIVFLLIGINFMLKGNKAIEALRGPPEQIAGSIAMPILVGPATVSASVIVGQQLNRLLAVLAVLTAVSVTILVMIALKILHDFVKPRNERLVQRYIEIMGRILALIVGIYAIEMIMQGLLEWLKRFSAAILS